MITDNHYLAVEIVTVLSEATLNDNLPSKRIREHSTHYCYLLIPDILTANQAIMFPFIRAMTIRTDHTSHEQQTVDRS